MTLWCEDCRVEFEAWPAPWDSWEAQTTEHDDHDVSDRSVKA